MREKIKKFFREFDKYHDNEDRDTNKEYWYKFLETFEKLSMIRKDKMIRDHIISRRVGMVDFLNDLKSIGQ